MALKFKHEKVLSAKLFLVIVEKFCRKYTLQVSEKIPPLPWKKYFEISLAVLNGQLNYFGSSLVDLKRKLNFFESSLVIP